MQPSIERSQIPNHHSADMNSKRFDLLYWGRLIAQIIIYCLVILFFIRSPLYPEWSITILGITLDLNALDGVLAQVQVLVSIGIVLVPKRRNYWIAVTLNIIQILMILYAIVLRKVAEPIPGLLVATSTIISITIIFKYGQRLSNQIERVTRQNKELMNLHAKDKESGKKLRHQNEQLKRYNRLLEKKEKVLQHFAYHDSLTELPNRKMMIDRIDMLTNAASEKKNFAFAFIDLDDFKIINDTLGHSFGDKVLKIIANRWKRLVHKDDMLARFGGDEFALLVQQYLSDEELLEYVRRFQNVLLDPVTVKHKSIYINFSCGITLYPRDGMNTVELLKNADIALYTVKNYRKNGIQFYTRQMQEEIMKKVRMGHCMRTSLRNGEFYIAFQPLYRCDTKTLRGFEVLARWNSKELGSISPAQFIPIAEETGFIVEIGRWILRTALSKMVSLQNSCQVKPVISVNISVMQMVEPSFIPMIKKIVEETGFDSNYLEFEITESAFTSYPDKIISVLHELSNLGIKVALDDFGTGYASLNYLQKLPIHTLKIDKTFIDRIQQDGEKLIVGNIIDLGHKLGFEVVAEGVETQFQLDYLSANRCDYFQGYLYSKPVDEQTIRQLLLNEPQL